MIDCCVCVCVCVCVYVFMTSVWCVLSVRDGDSRAWLRLNHHRNGQRDCKYCTEAAGAALATPRQWRTPKLKCECLLYDVCVVMDYTGLSPATDAAGTDIHVIGELCTLHHSYPINANMLQSIPSALLLPMILVVSILVLRRWIHRRSEEPNDNSQTAQLLKVDAIDPKSNSDLEHSVLVIGGSGFIGRHVVSQIEAMANTSVFDVCLPEKPYQNVTYFVGDMLSHEHLKEALQGVDTVFLLAAKKPSVYSTFAGLFEVNTLGVQHVVNACVESGVERLIFTSTASATALARGKPSLDMDEAWPFPSEHMCDYSRTKAMAERIVSNANGVQTGVGKTKTLYTSILRPTAVYGVGDNSLISMIYKNRRSGRYIGDGECLIDFVDVDSVAQAHICAFKALLDKPKTKGGHTFNVGSGQPMSLKRFVGAYEETPGSGRNHWGLKVASGFPLWMFKTLILINKFSVSISGYAILGRSISPTAISHTQRYTRDDGEGHGDAGGGDSDGDGRNGNAGDGIGIGMG